LRPAGCRWPIPQSSIYVPRVWDAFITNAVKYAYPKGNSVIEVSAREIKRHLRVEVSDQGIGLPDGFAIDQPSASLGFKVTSGMVRQLNGHLTIVSNRPKGAHFLLDLPILPKHL
jgi:two-component system, sensor histidine kinase PdtaS